MNIEQLKGKKVAILGVGMEGIAVANFVLNYTQDITLLDKMPEGELAKRAEDMGDEKLSKILSDNRFKKSLGPEYLDNLSDFEIVFRSPGIPYLEPKIQEAKTNGVEINSQIKLFFDLCPCPIIGVTGTKGKGTTSSLIELMLRKSKVQNPKLKNIYLAGNIGEPAITLIDKLSKDDIVVLELSSFQLQDLHKSPHIAVVLNISIDHLDYHKDEVEYKESKVNIVKYQTNNDFSVINQDYLTSFEFASQTEAQVYYFSAKDSVDQGSFIRKATPTKLFHRKGTEKNNTTIQQYNNITMEQSSNDLYEVILRVNDDEQVICRSDEIQLIGRHNLENIAAAAVTAKLAGANIESIKSAASEFKGLPHRLELVAEINGVKYYNDSFATNPGPTMAAIQSFSEPLHLILGGSSKSADFSELAKVINDSNIASVNLIGLEGEKIERSLKESKSEKAFSKLNGDINTIVREVAASAKPGEIVLFSPACASFDMFKNYKDRGEKFKKAVLLISNG